MKTGEILSYLDSIAPSYLQESYDNSGLQVGNADEETKGVLITLDVNEWVIQEAIELGYRLIVAHHPLIFKPLKKISNHTEVERCIIQLIANRISLYVMHTNLDNAPGGLNHLLAARLGVSYPKVLAPGIGRLNKIVTFCPSSALTKVREAMFRAGGGQIGKYDMCSYSGEGKGTYRPLAGSDPCIGTENQLHTESEYRLEMIVPEPLTDAVVGAMKSVHPYEEVAYDVIGLINHDPYAGSGCYGELTEPIPAEEFIQRVKTVLNIPYVRHTSYRDDLIGKVGVCGGSGGFLAETAIRKGLDAYITSDLKYHQMMEVQGRILLIDAGHYETEILMTELLDDAIRKKFPTFACSISGRSINPVKYT